MEVARTDLGVVARTDFGMAEGLLPDSESMRVSRETIYRSLFIQAEEH